MKTNVGGEQISHFCEVVESNPQKGYVKLRIEDGSDCGSCPAVKLCNHGKSEEYIVIETNEVYDVGMHVRIVGTELMHRKAIMLAVVYPCVVLIVAMLLTYLLTMNESLSALVGLLLMILFFIVLYLVRNKIAREFKFEIEKLNNNKI